jgi:hypothetical protein
MKLKAFTLIEGIVSMVMLSLLLSVGGLISFNLYRSLPRNEEVRMQGMLSAKLDSLIELRTLQDVQFEKGSYYFDYSTEAWQNSPNLYVGELIISDTLGRKQEMHRIFVSYEN